MKIRNIWLITGFIVLGMLINSVLRALLRSWMWRTNILWEPIEQGLFPALGYLVMMIGLLVVLFDLLRPFLHPTTSVQIQGLTIELDEARKRVEAQPEKAKPAWDLASARLQLYFDRNLRQMESIYTWSLVVMIVGFLFVLAGLTLSFLMPPQQVQAGSAVGSNAITPAAVGVIAGIITEFIGATFLIIYRSTIQQAGMYTKTLERINSVGMAMQILDTISPQATQLQDSTKAEIVMMLLSRGGGLEPDSTQSSNDKGDTLRAREG
jgi:hypothetical protein